MSDSGWFAGFCSALDCFVDEGTKDEILGARPTVSDPPDVAMSACLAGMVERMASLLDEATMDGIFSSLGRGCAEIHDTVQRAVSKRQAFDTLRAFLEAEKQEPTVGSRLHREGDVVYVHYDPVAYGLRCFCSLRHALPDDEVAHAAWCGCGQAFQQAVWEGILSRPAIVDVLETTISGGSECRFAIRL